MVRKLVIDSAIPFIEPLFTGIADVIAVPAHEICPAQVKDADGLIVRSVTQVNQALLERSKVRFVGTATIGTEHLDSQWLNSQAIHQASAPGCNALAVVQYVMSALSYWLNQQNRTLTDLVVGIVGVGHIGSRLHSTLQHLGVECLLCDPPLAAQGKLVYARSLEELATQCDVITLHTPLTQTGPFLTKGMINESFFKQFSVDGLLINAARGGLIENQPLLNWINAGGSVVLDVWPHEPLIAHELLRDVVLGTPHIAGYSLEGKRNASYQMYCALANFWDESIQIKLDDLGVDKEVISLQEASKLEDCFLKSYSITQDAEQLRRVYKQNGAEGFNKLRNNYLFRRDFSGQLWTGDESVKALSHFLSGLV